jgi:hypothetical protein
MAKATAMDKDDRATAARRKRREDPVADRAGKGGKPINVKTEAYDLNESYIEEKNAPTNPALWSRAKSLAKSKFDVYPSAYANGWASKWYKGKGGGWKSVSESVSEASVLDSPEGQKKLQNVWHRAQRRAISATGDGGVLSSRGYEPGKLNLALKVQKSAYKRIHDKNFHDKPVVEDVDSMFAEKFGKDRESVARSGQEPKDKDLVMRSGDRKTSDKGYRTQAINKQVIEAKAPKWDEKEFKLVRPGMWRHHTGDSSIHYGGDNKSYTVMHGNDRDPVKYKTLDGAQKAVRAKYVKEAKDSGEYDYEGDMAMSQLRSIMHNAQEICDMLKPNTNLPEWVQSKITLAADYISTCADYLESNKEDIKEDATQKMKKVKDVAIRMANGKIEMHPPGKSGSSSGGISEEKKAVITKNVSYRGNTTGDAEWHVHDENGRHIRSTKTKKEANMWKDIHELPKEELHKKYPELKP